MGGLLLVLFFLSITCNFNLAQAEANLQQSCMNGECSEMARLWGYTLAALVLSVGPHISRQMKEIDVTGEAGLGVGGTGVYEFKMQLLSPLGASERFKIRTRTEVQLMGEKLPARLNFGIGLSEKIKIDLDNTWIWSLGPFAEKFERESVGRYGAYASSRWMYRWSDYQFSVLNMDYSITKEPVYRIGVGQFFKLDSTSDGYLVEASYSQINALAHNLWFLDLQMSF